jgi:ferredoxin
MDTVDLHKLEKRIKAIESEIPSFFSVRDQLVKDFDRIFRGARHECIQCGEKCGRFLRACPPKLHYKGDFKIEYTAYKNDYTLVDANPVQFEEDKYKVGWDAMMKTLVFYRGNCKKR